MLYCNALDADKLESMYYAIPRRGKIDLGAYQAACVLIFVWGTGKIAAFDLGDYLTVEVMDGKGLDFSKIRIFIERCREFEKPIRFVADNLFIIHCAKLLNFEKHGGIWTG